MAEDTGDKLTFEVIEELYLKQPNISCICFMGGDRHPDIIAALIMTLKRQYPRLKFAMYSGRVQMYPILSKLLDYYKLGPYVEECGPLNNPNTNQFFYSKQNGEWVDTTFLFQREKF